jgi:hypothetical protein
MADSPKIPEKPNVDNPPASPDPKTDPVAPPELEPLPSLPPGINTTSVAVPILDDLFRKDRTPV